MAQFSNLFKKKRGRNTSHCRLFNKSITSSTNWQPVLEKSSFRLVIFSKKDNELLLDSDAVTCSEVEFNPGCQYPAPNLFNQLHRKLIGSKPSVLPRKYQLTKEKDDIGKLQNVVFGTTPLNTSRSDFKVHVVDKPSDIMLTKLFTCDIAETIPERRVSLDSSVPYSSLPLPVPGRGLLSATASESLPGSLRSSSPGNSSLHARWYRQRVAGLRASRSALDMDSIQACPRPPTKRRYGLAVILRTPPARKPRDSHNLEQLRNFIFAHIALIERHLLRLQKEVEEALTYLEKKEQNAFFGKTMNAFDILTQSIVDLYTAPRLTEPVWRSLMGRGFDRVRLCTDFLHDFMELVERCDTRMTGFFVSKLITAVLTYHLAWVSTVAPAHSVRFGAYLDKHDADWVETFARSHPYNPLIAQLSDLHGAIGEPLGIARTVVVGRRADLVCRILHVLSYLLRCSDVREASQMHQSTPLFPAHDCACCQATAAHQSAGGYLVGESCFYYKTEELDEVLPAEPPSVLHRVPLKAAPTGGAGALFVRTNSEISTPSLTDLRWSYSGEDLPPKSPSSPSSGSYQDLDDELFAAQCTGKTREQTSSIVADQTETTTLRHVQNSSSEGLTHTAEDITENTEQIHEAKLEEFREFESQRQNLDSRDDIERATETPAALSDVDNAVVVDKMAASEEKSDSDLETPEKELVCRLSTAVMAEPKVERLRAVGREATAFKYEFAMLNNRYVSGDSGRYSTETTDKTSSMQIKDSGVFDDSYSSAITNLESKPNQEFAGAKQKQDRVPLKLDTQTAERNISTTFGAKKRCSLSPKSRSTCPRNRVQSQEVEETYDVTDCNGMEEIPMPLSVLGRESTPEVASDLGQSLLAGYVTRFLPDCVLQGTGDPAHVAKVRDALQDTLRTSGLDEPAKQALAIVADTDKWCVKIHTCRCRDPDDIGIREGAVSQLVEKALQSLRELYRLKMSPEFCVMHFEAKLQEIYFKSVMLSEYVAKLGRIDMKDLAPILGIDLCDLPLLLNVSSVHSPAL